MTDFCHDLETDDGCYFIYVKWFRHWRTRRIIHAPPGKAFRLRIRSQRRKVR